MSVMIASTKWDLMTLKKVIPTLSDFEHAELFTTLLKEISSNFYDSKDVNLQEFSRILNEFVQRNSNLKEILVESEKWIECTLKWINRKSKSCNGKFSF